MIDVERWRKFSKRDQLGHIGAELYRAAEAQVNDAGLVGQMLERAIDFIDLTLEDEKWRENPLPLLKLRGKISQAYVGQIADIASIYALL